MDCQQFDIEIGRAMRDVRIPRGLKQNILDALAEVEDVERDQTEIDNQVADVRVAVNNDTDTCSIETPTVVPLARRRWVVTSLASCVIAGLTIWQFWSASDTSFSLKELREKVILEVKDLPKFDRKLFVAELPLGWHSLPIDSAKGFSVSGNDPHLTALFGFDFRVSRRQSVSGVLLAIPKQFVADPPEANSLDSAQVVYLRRGIATAAWVEREFVYICFVRGSGANLEQLQDRLRIQPT